MQEQIRCWGHLWSEVSEDNLWLSKGILYLKMLKVVRNWYAQRHRGESKEMQLEVAKYLQTHWREDRRKDAKQRD